MTLFSDRTYHVPVRVTYEGYAVVTAESAEDAARVVQETRETLLLHFDRVCHLAVVAPIAERMDEVSE